MYYKVIKGDEINARGIALPQNIKKSDLLSGSWSGSYATAVIVVDGVKAKVEAHEHAADVWVLLKGKGKCILGGEMKNPSIVREGELEAEEIIGGEEFEIEPGDVIDIPQGVPHQFDARGARMEFLIFKVNGL